MDILLLPFIAFVVVAAIVLALKQLSKGSADSAPPTFPYERAAFLSAAERSFLGALEQSVEGRFRIFAKVRLADLVKVRSGLSRSQRTSAFNRISRKHVDFVLCTLGDASVKAVVELDDKSHASPDRKDRDSFVDRALGAAGIECLHVPAASGYSVHQLRRMLEPVVGDFGADRPVEDATTVTGLPSNAAAKSDVLTAGAAMDAAPMSSSDELTCPRCGSAMVERVAKRGANKGERFMACSAFPSCRYTEAV